MTRSDFTENQRWLLGQLDAPVRAGRIKLLFEQRLRRLLDWGFAVSSSEGGATASLGALPLVTAFCESDPPNADSVCNHVARCVGHGAFQADTIIVVDKSDTGPVAVEQLEQALAILRKYREEITSPEVPMAWAYDGKL